MYLKSVFRMTLLMLHFRNGRTLVDRMRAAEPRDEVVLWGGTRISHPPGRGGLLEAVVELWLEHAYTAGFYRPADGDVIVAAGRQCRNLHHPDGAAEPPLPGVARSRAASGCGGSGRHSGHPSLRDCLTLPVLRRSIS